MKKAKTYLEAHLVPQIPPLDEVRGGGHRAAARRVCPDAEGHGGGGARGIVLRLLDVVDLDVRGGRRGCRRDALEEVARRDEEGGVGEAVVGG